MSSATQLTCPIESCCSGDCRQVEDLDNHRIAKADACFSELPRELDRIAPEVMSRQLRSLEADGLVRRVAHDEVPPRVDYALTPAGAGLMTISNLLQRWVVANRDGLASATDGVDPAKFGDV